MHSRLRSDQLPSESRGTTNVARTTTLEMNREFPNRTPSRALPELL
jgi:hypothetical protein